MELAFGRALFERYGRYAANPELLEDAVADMQARARRFAGRQRDHTPTGEYPFTVVLVDEVAFLTAHQADRKLKDFILAALATSPPRAGRWATAWWLRCRTPERRS